MGVVALNLV